MTPSAHKELSAHADEDTSPLSRVETTLQRLSTEEHEAAVPSTSRSASSEPSSSAAPEPATPLEIVERVEPQLVAAFRSRLLSHQQTAQGIADMPTVGSWNVERTSTRIERGRKGSAAGVTL